MFTLVIALAIVAAFVALCIAYRVHGPSDATERTIRARLQTYGTRRTMPATSYAYSHYIRARLRTYGMRTRPTHWQ